MRIRSAPSASWIALILATTLCSALRIPASARPMELEDLFRLHRLSDPQISPDGRRVAYVIGDPIKAENRSTSSIWVVPLAGGEPRVLAKSAKHFSHPRWSPDGRWIAFESDQDGPSQIWLVPSWGGEFRKLTTLSTGAGQPVWSPDGRRLAFVSAVFPEFSSRPFAESDRLNREKAAAQEKDKVKARLLTQLYYRHWNAWVGGRRQHLFILSVAQGAPVGEPRDLTPGDRDAVPTSSTFSAGDDFAFSPDGAELAYTATPVPTREEAWSTNHDVWAVNLASGERRALTTNPAADGYPRYSPDGKWLAYRAQARPGLEADRWQLIVLDRASGARHSLTAQFDSSVGAFVWSPDSARIYFEAEERASEPIWSVELAGGAPVKLFGRGANSDLAVSRDGRSLVFLHQRMTAPAEVMRLDLGTAEPQPLSRANAGLLATLTMSPPETATVAGADGAPVQLWVVKPPRFDPAKKYPLVLWVHGGPQTAFLDSWSFRWNAELWAAQGYVIALPNPHGSTGFGQDYTDEISRDWGGEPFTDLMACLAWLKRQPYIDATRMAAAGASYGGYMMDWFEGHTDQFRTIVTHDGVYNFDMMYGTTDELWFEEHEHGIPWETPDFDRFSPHRFAANFKTPMLIIHNALDYRVPLSQGEALFTTLQRQGIRSELLSFPDEGHWVLKPLNSERWHQAIFAWLADYLKP